MEPEQPKGPHRDEPTNTPDFADIAVAQWSNERSDLDFSAMGTLARFGRLHLLGGELIDSVLEAHGLDRGEFEILAGLRRGGDPYQMTPSQIASALLVTRAGITKRVDRLERRGLVERKAVADDRRSIRVTLTEKGLDCIERAVVSHVANEDRLLLCLTKEEKSTLDRTLRKLLVQAALLGEEFQ